MRLIILPLLFIASLSYADTELEELELLSYRLSSAFAAFIFFEGQADYLNSAKKILAEGSQRLKTLENQHSDIHSLWHQAEDFIANNTNRSFDGTDATLEAGWSLMTLELQEKISTINQNSYSSNAIRLQIEMEQVLANYMRYANSSFGGYGISRSGRTIEERVADIDKMIPEYFPDNRRLQNKWRFIRRTLLAYNEQTSPYIVFRTFDDMRKIIRR
ncbi:hypothetical protein [Bacterioplanoides sp.]|uniref:hypothetical protein n=1 Tax=Bacterioplanoides sp. TaxID=2066072 RepID=UPI003AFFDF11